VRSAGDGDAGRFVGAEQSGQDRLNDQGCGAGRTYIEMKIAAWLSRGYGEPRECSRYAGACPLCKTAPGSSAISGRRLLLYFRQSRLFSSVPFTQAQLETAAMRAGSAHRHMSLHNRIQHLHPESLAVKRRFLRKRGRSVHDGLSSGPDGSNGIIRIVHDIAARWSLCE